MINSNINELLKNKQIPLIYLPSLKIMKNAINKLTILFNQNSVDHTHGISHALIVVNHAVSATNASPIPLSDNQIQNIILASLLHDADDKKYFPFNKNYDNARAILKDQGFNAERIEDIIGMICAVSYSKNGDNVDQNKAQSWYYPRYCDRIDAIGFKGIVRCYQYAKVVKNPISCQDTPKPLNFQELMAVCQGRDQLYIKRCGTSQSFIDHFYDKLMHLKLPKHITNPYLQNKYEEGKNQIANFVIKHARSNFSQVQEQLEEYLNAQKVNNKKIMI